MTERTPEQAALMDLIFEYAQATAAPTGDTADEHQVWENRVEGLYRQIEAIVCAPKTNEIPEGWQLVPIEPTAAMLYPFSSVATEATYCEAHYVEPDEFLDAYKEALAKAPTPNT